MSHSSVITILKYGFLYFLCIVGVILWGSFDILGASWVINDLTLLTFKILSWFILGMINVFFLVMASIIGCAIDDNFGL